MTSDTKALSRLLQDKLNARARTDARAYAFLHALQWHELSDILPDYICGLLDELNRQQDVILKHALICPNPYGDHNG